MAVSSLIAPNGSKLVARPGPDAEVCGRCRFSHVIPENIEVIECHGVPPTPVVIGGKPNIAGQVQLGVELLRARLPWAEAGCALWKVKAL